MLGTDIGVLTQHIECGFVTCTLSAKAISYSSVEVESLFPLPPSLSMTACIAIESCADVRCSNQSDHTCHECDSHYGDVRGEAAYRNLVNECLRESNTKHYLTPASPIAWSHDGLQLS